MKSTFLSSYKPIAIILILTALIFSKVGDFDFLLYDDNRYVTNNFDIQDLSVEGIKKMIWEPQFSDELIPPLTTISLAVNYAIGGSSPAGYHYTNLLFHLLNTFLVWFLLVKISKRYDLAIFVAAIFAFHPVIVEAVAWVAARKEVLYTFFYLLATLFAIAFWEKKSLHWYILSLAMFFLAYHSKYAAAAFPLWYISLAIFWKNRRDWGKIALESIPLFVLPLRSFWLSIQGSKASDTITENIDISAAATQIDASGELYYNALSLIQKIILGGYSLVKYLSNFLFPVHQQIIYPYPEINADGGFAPSIYLLSILGWLLFGFALYGLFRAWQKKDNVLIFGLLIFGVHVLLLLHILPIGGRVITADRYMYIPHIGLTILFYWLIQSYLPKFKYHLMIGSVAACMLLTHLRLPNWENTETVFSHLLEKDPDFATARVLLATYYYDTNRKTEAEEEFIKSLEKDPNNFAAHINVAAIYIEKNIFDKAEFHLKRALEIESGHAGTYYNLALVYLKQNIYPKALEYFTKGVEYNDYGGFHHLSYYNIASIHQTYGRYQQAIEAYEQAVQRKSDFDKAYHRLAIVYHKLNQNEKAIENAKMAIRVNPNNTDARMDVLKLLEETGDFKGLLSQAEVAIQRMPNDARGYYYRGIAHFGLKAFAEACNDWATASNIPEAKELLRVHCDS